MVLESSAAMALFLSRTPANPALGLEVISGASFAGIMAMDSFDLPAATSRKTPAEISNRDAPNIQGLGVSSRLCRYMYTI